MAKGWRPSPRSGVGLRLFRVHPGSYQVVGEGVPWPVQRSTTAASSAVLIGLVTKSSMPASMHRSRSPARASAVSATMGV